MYLIYALKLNNYNKVIFTNKSKLADKWMTKVSLISFASTKE